MADENIVERFVVTLTCRKPLPHLIDTIANHLSTVDKISSVQVNKVALGVQVEVEPNDSVPLPYTREDAMRDSERLSLGLSGSRHRAHWHAGLNGKPLPPDCMPDQYAAYFEGKDRRAELEREALVVHVGVSNTEERTRDQVAYDNIGKPQDQTHFSGYLVTLPPGPSVSELQAEGLFTGYVEDGVATTGYMQLEDDESASRAMDRLARDLLGIGA